MAKGGKGAGPQFSSLGDMFDGGGAGASGGAFKGHNGFTNAIAAIGNGLRGGVQGNQPAPAVPERQSMAPPSMPPRPAMPQMPSQQPAAPRWGGEATGPHGPASPGPAQGPSMPYPGVELSDQYLSNLRMRANQGDASALEMLQRYEQRTL
ncbi:hypothetical protein [Phaeobacter inhibens]|uniref:hypothetical protein n=1 Tax=Phaeobacter inhibens TaxID=221822 RepID=UPI000C9AB1F5|nr:hypothetical protein [Phaeobacter inhibens]AUQ64428.1 hypothetical protein PhaeoP51_03497 [Phaeobacter inhibens]